MTSEFHAPAASLPYKCPGTSLFRACVVLGAFPGVMETKNVCPIWNWTEIILLFGHDHFLLINFQYLSHHSSLRLQLLASDTASAFEHPQAKYDFLYTTERYCLYGSFIPGSSEMWYCRRMEKISWTDHLRNEEMLRSNFNVSPCILIHWILYTN